MPLQAPQVLHRGQQVRLVHFLERKGTSAECNCPRQDHMGSVAVQGRCLQLRRDKHAWGMHFAYCLPHRAHIDIMMATMRAGAIIVNTAQPR